MVPLRTATAIYNTQICVEVKEEMVGLSREGQSHQPTNQPAKSNLFFMQTKPAQITPEYLFAAVQLSSWNLYDY